MSDPNPCELPGTDDMSRDVPNTPRGKPQVLWFVLLAFVGAILGYVFFAHPVKGSHSVGAGMGGFIGLAIGILLRAVRAVIPNR